MSGLGSGARVAIGVAISLLTGIFGMLVWWPVCYSYASPRPLGGFAWFLVVVVLVPLIMLCNALMWSP